MTEKLIQLDDPDDDWIEGTKDETICTLLHLGFWVALVVGLWTLWEPAMMIGFFMAASNMTAMYLPIVINALVFLAFLPFKPKTPLAVNIRIFLGMNLAVQIWQVSFWLMGRAAN